MEKIFDGQLFGINDVDKKYYFLYRSHVEMCLFNKDLESDLPVADISKIDRQDLETSMRELIKYTLKTFEKTAHFNDFLLDLRNFKLNLSYSCESVSRGERAFISFLGPKFHFEFSKTSEPIYVKTSDNVVFKAVSEVTNICGNFTEDIYINGDIDKIKPCLLNPENAIVQEDIICVRRDVKENDKVRDLADVFIPGTVTKCFKYPNCNSFAPYPDNENVLFNGTYGGFIDMDKNNKILGVYEIIYNTCTSILQENSKNKTGEHPIKK